MRAADAAAPDDPEARVASAEGVDLTLVRWMLSLTPAERLAAVEAMARSILELRRGLPRP
jgi:hypothetical protein